MPTLLPRFQVTQTPQVERALEVAARAWPDQRRPALVQRLLEEGAAAIEARLEARSTERRATLERTQGSFAYPTGYLDDIRAEWDE